VVVWVNIVEKVEFTTAVVVVADIEVMFCSIVTRVVLVSGMIDVA
jgi:hypothetical protein